MNEFDQLVGEAIQRVIDRDRVHGICSECSCPNAIGHEESCSQYRPFAPKGIIDVLGVTE